MRLLTTFILILLVITGGNVAFANVERQNEDEEWRDIRPIKTGQVEQLFSFGPAGYNGRLVAHNLKEGLFTFEVSQYCPPDETGTTPARVDCVVFTRETYQLDIEAKTAHRIRKIEISQQERTRLSPGFEEKLIDIINFVREADAKSEYEYEKPPYHIYETYNFDNSSLTVAALYHDWNGDSIHTHGGKLQFWAPEQALIGEIDLGLSQLYNMYKLPAPGDGYQYFAYESYSCGASVCGLGMDIVRVPAH